MKSILIFLLILPTFLWGQTTISGTINHYAAVIVYQQNDCGGILELGDASAFENDSLAIIIQMKGAQMNEGNNTSFGTITQIGAAGYYELVHINTVNGNEVTISASLLNIYDFSSGVQLVSLPVYDEVTVQGTLDGLPWNGSMGGVIVLKAANLTMNAGINANGLGFRGGVADITASNNCTALTNANNYWYDISDWRGAQKGEGVAAVIVGKESGRGPQVNGGGGANDHNAGGGGGANVTAGGQGGENREPSFFGCDGNYPGLGGRAISAGNDRIFPGGGGGAGHENNEVGTDGGQGGGIVILLANEYHGNDNLIEANGMDVPATVGADGAGGGGGGGTIILLAATADGVKMEAKGGNGGVANNGGADRCMGPGGGGSGGRILSNLMLTSDMYTLEGGVAGQSINSTACSPSTNGALGGQMGILESLSVMPEHEATFTAPAFLANTAIWQACEGQSMSLNPIFEGEDLSYQWEINTGSGFVPLMEDGVYQGVTSAVLTILVPDILMNAYQYRLILSSTCFEPVVSEEFNLAVEPSANAAFSAEVNGLDLSLSNSSSNADTYSWDFGDGGSSNLFEPEHSYETGGTYTITLTVSNDCGQHFYSQTIEIGVAPEAGFSSTHSGGCAPLEVTFINESLGDYNQIEWVFSGGSPATSLEENPIVLYETPGIYEAILTVSGGLGQSSFTEEEAVVVESPPSSSFEYQILAPNIVSFQNTSQNANYYNWDFGDGTTSIEENPTHEFLESGVFEVTLNAQNNFCGNAFLRAVDLITSTDDLPSKSLFIYPNPVKDYLHIFSKEGILTAQIFDSRAALILTQTIYQGRRIDVSFLKTGIYFLALKGVDRTTVLKFVKAAY